MKAFLFHRTLLEVPVDSTQDPTSNSLPLVRHVFTQDKIPNSQQVSCTIYWFDESHGFTHPAQHGDLQVAVETDSGRRTKATPALLRLKP